MNPSSQDTIIDTLTLFLPHCGFLTKPNLEVWRASQKKKKVEYSLWWWEVGSDKERRLSKKGEGDSTQALNVL